MIAIFGATGMTGGAAARELRRRGLPVRALVRDTSKAAPLVQVGCEVAQAAVTDGEALAAGLAGASAALVFCPLNPRATDSVAEHRAVADTIGRAVERARPGHVVVISDYGAHQTCETGLTRIFVDLERRMRRSGAPLTVIRSAEHMENWGGLMRVAAETGRLVEYYGPPVRRMALVSSGDVGLIAADYLAADGGPTTPNVVHVEGPTRYTPTELTETVGGVIGQPVVGYGVTEAEWFERVRGRATESHARLVVDLVAANNAGRLDVEPGGEVLRGPTALEDALRAVWQPA